MTKTALALVASALLVCAGGAQPTRYTIKQNLAFATLVASTECVTAQIVIDGAISVTTRSGPQPTPDFAGDLIISEIDTCLNAQRGGVGETDEIVSTGDLHRATLAGKIPVQDSLGNIRTVSVALTWTGIGKVKEEKVDNGVGAPLMKEGMWSRSASVSGTVDGLSVTTTTSAMLIERRGIVDTR